MHMNLRYSHFQCVAISLHETQYLTVLSAYACIYMLLE